MGKCMERKGKSLTMPITLNKRAVSKRCLMVAPITLSSGWFSALTAASFKIIELESAVFPF